MQLAPPFQRARQGEVIGVVTAKLNAATVFQWTGVLPEGVSYAVKSAYLQPLLDSLPKMGVRFDWRADMIVPDSSAEEIAAQATPFVVMVIASKR